LKVPILSHGSNLEVYMKNDKLVEYFQPDEKFMAEVEKIKKSGRRLSDKEKEKLLRKARPVVYGK
jgi:predicted phosphoribosyltransferase